MAFRRGWESSKAALNTLWNFVGVYDNQAPVVRGATGPIYEIRQVKVVSLSIR